MHAAHSGAPAVAVGTLPQYSNITCLTSVGNNLNGSPTPPLAHSALGMSSTAGPSSSPVSALQSDYAPAASLVAAGYSYATSGSGLDNGKCPTARPSVCLGVPVNQSQLIAR